MAGSAKRLQVFKRVVPAFFRGSNAVSINVMHMEVILCPAALASVSIPFQSPYPVAAKTIVVLCFLPVILHLFRVIRAPFTDFGNSDFVNAIGATHLRASRVFKSIAAVCTPQNIAFSWRSFKITFLSTVLTSLHSRVIFCTRWTSFLVSACRLVLLIAHDAITFTVSRLCFAVYSHCAVFAPFLIRRRFLGCFAAIRAVKMSVLRHFNSKLAKHQHHNKRAF